MEANALNVLSASDTQKYDSVFSLWHARGGVAVPAIESVIAPRVPTYANTKTTA